MWFSWLLLKINVWYFWWRFLIYSYNFYVHLSVGNKFTAYGRTCPCFDYMIICISCESHNDIKIPFSCIIIIEFWLYSKKNLSEFLWFLITLPRLSSNVSPRYYKEKSKHQKGLKSMTPGSKPRICRQSNLRFLF